MRIIRPPVVPPEPFAPAQAVPAPVAAPPTAAAVSAPRQEVPPPDIVLLQKETEALEAGLRTHVEARMTSSLRTLQDISQRVMAIPTASATAADSPHMAEALETYRRKLEALDASFEAERQRWQQALQQRDAALESVNEAVSETRHAVVQVQKDYSALKVAAPVSAVAPVKAPAEPSAPPLLLPVDKMPSRTDASAPPPVVTKSSVPRMDEIASALLPMENDFDMLEEEEMPKRGIFGRLMAYLNGTAIEIAPSNKEKPS
jgi:hypothetical protein